MISSKHRHRARRLAVQALCCLDAQGPHVLDLAVEFIRESREPVETLALAQEMLHGAWQHHEKADAAMSVQSLHWDLRRMALVDRNILRLSIWELAERTAPHKVIITEAVRLAKEFSTGESPRFVNGVLDAIARQFEPPPGAAAEEADEVEDDPSPADEDEPQEDDDE